MISYHTKPLVYKHFYSASLFLLGVIGVSSVGAGGIIFSWSIIKLISYNTSMCLYKCIRGDTVAVASAINSRRLLSINFLKHR